MDYAKIKQRILDVIAGDGVSYTTLQLARAVWREKADCDCFTEIDHLCQSLENEGLLQNDGNNMWERDDPEFQDIWKITPRGLQQANIN